jgi:hypothetical protein
MNWDAIGAVGESVGALAVLVTLIYLAIQVRHAIRSQQADAIRANRQERREYHTDFRDSPYIPGILQKISEGEALTEAEETRLLHHYASTWGLAYSEWIQSQLQWRGRYATSLKVSFEYLFAQPRSLDFFDFIGRDLYPEEFVRYVDELLEDYRRRAGASPP